MQDIKVPSLRGDLVVCSWPSSLSTNNLRDLKITWAQETQFAGDRLLCAADLPRLSQKIVSSGLGLDEVEGVTRRLLISQCCTVGLSTGRLHACLWQPQDLPEHALLGQPLPVCAFEGRSQGNQGADEDVCRPQVLRRPSTPLRVTSGALKDDVRGAQG